MALKKRVVVTGCAGFLGSHLVEELVKRGDYVIGYDNLERGQVSLDNLSEIKNKNFEFVCGDILDFNKLKTVIKDGIDVVYHLAALPSHRLALENPHKFISVDVQGTENVLEAARLAFSKPLVVFASSNKVYGKQACPWVEDKDPKPEGPYAVGKYTSELLCQMYEKYFFVPTLALRYHHVAGTRSNPELALSVFVEQALEGRNLEVHGLKTSTGFESCSANYTHVDDAIRATILAADSYQSFDIFNIANSVTITVESMARWILDRIKTNSKIEYVEMLPHETLVHASDVSKAKNRLGFSARKSAEEAFSDYVEWRLAK